MSARACGGGIRLPAMCAQRPRSAASPVVFATYRGRPEITADDALLADALRARGVEVRGARWDSEIAWAAAAAVIVRSTWDYHHRLDEFLQWTTRVGAVTALHNDPAVIAWNAHKGYLNALAAAGVPVIETAWIARAESADVAAMTREHDWEAIVIKPAVSASAFETRSFRRDEMDAAQAHLQRLTARGDAMVQPLVPTLAERGELSLLHANGAFSHAVRRRSALAEDPMIPRTASADAPDGARALATEVLAAVQQLLSRSTAPLYARVDLAESSRAGAFFLLELELVEPSLFLAHAPGAAARFAEAIVARL